MGRKNPGTITTTNLTNERHCEDIADNGFPDLFKYGRMINTMPNHTVPQPAVAHRIALKEAGLVIAKGAMSCQNLVNIEISMESPCANFLENHISHPTDTTYPARLQDPDQRCPS